MRLQYQNAAFHIEVPDCLCSIAHACGVELEWVVVFNKECRQHFGHFLLVYLPQFVSKSGTHHQSALSHLNATVLFFVFC